MKFKKEYFEKHKPISNKKNLDELIDMDITSIEGDINTGNREIQTGPINKPYNDNSNYEKGLSTTTDKLSRYAQPRSWWALYYGYGGTPYSHGNKPVSESTDLSEDKLKLKKMLEDLVKTKQTSDIVKKYNDTDLNQEIDINQISDSAIASLVNDLVTQLNSGSIKDEERDIIIKYINQTLS